MTVRPYVLLSGRVISKLQACLLEAVREWSKDWGVNTPVAVICEQLSDVSTNTMPATWHLSYVAERKKVWFATNMAELETALRKQLFPSDRRLDVTGQANGSIAFATAKHAASDLFERLASTLGFIPADIQNGAIELDASVTEPASGAALIQIELADRSIAIVMNHACLTSTVADDPAVSGSAAPLMGLAQALNDVPVVLPIEIGRVELDVASLVSLGVGDVVRLSATVDAPLEIRNDSGATLFNAYLGMRDGLTALEIASNNK